MQRLRFVSWISPIVALTSAVLFSLTVFVLGLVTPGYNHMNHTISRLAIERYGIFQIFNFLQFSFGLYVTGATMAATMTKNSSKLVIRTVFTVCAALLILAAFVPTDPVENVRFSISMYSPRGIIHASTVMVFLLISPYGIYRLADALAAEPMYRSYARLTAFMGFSAFLTSITWILFFLLGIALEYSGLFQKAIALWTIIWLVIMNVAVITPMGNRKKEEVRS